jgi:hypothetical protein
VATADCLDREYDDVSQHGRFRSGACRLAGGATPPERPMARGEGRAGWCSNPREWVRVLRSQGAQARHLNAGMGSLYRSKHELVFVYRVGTAPHLNTVELGRHGRNRTNVWDYASVNSMRGSRREDLTLHPTVKPTGLVADAIQDVTRRGDLVLLHRTPQWRNAGVIDGGSAPAANSSGRPGQQSDGRARGGEMDHPARGLASEACGKSLSAIDAVAHLARPRQRRRTACLKKA